MQNPQLSQSSNGMSTMLGPSQRQRPLHVQRLAGGGGHARLLVMLRLLIQRHRGDENSRVSEANREECPLAGRDDFRETLRSGAALGEGLAKPCCAQAGSGWREG